ncbi:uncharacterized protein [Eurosta solidaginis]|uniref:uncharacterized protein n=1 Tax=Eurosta solidaginis TaxID=178769 RepID=UPI0035311A5A
MGQLPSSRVNSARLFQHTGVDYAGPFTLKERRGRTPTTYKAYVPLFICSATSYIHLELVTDYTAEAFIAAYKRFSGIYDVSKTLTSDQGTNFIGADKELKQLFSSASSEMSRLSHLLSKDGTQWRFNPPSAPNFGGHWEAGVKSMKHHLKRVMKSYLFSFEEFTTALRQIQAVLNSRPLCRITDDPDDMNYLTPGHFFVGGPIASLPEPSLTQVPQSRLSHWQLTKRLTEQFWEKWQKEYLQQLQSRYKWQLPTTSVQVGSIVLLIDERYPPSKWPLGKVIKLHPGRDGLTRVVTVKTAITTLDRPINKLCLLPNPVNQTEEDSVIQPKEKRHTT